MTDPVEMDGTHILGGHAEIAIRTGLDCTADRRTPAQAAAIFDVILQCLDLHGGATASVWPSTGGPKYVQTNRLRSTTTAAAPMNPLARHHASGQSRRPGGDTDSGYWRSEYQRVNHHADRCEVVRRAAHYLSTLLRPDPDEVGQRRAELTEDHLRDSVLLEGRGFPPSLVGQRFRLAERTVITWRIADDRHPVTGETWTPPTDRNDAADQAREMAAAGVNATDIGTSLGYSASTVRNWTTGVCRIAA